MRWPDALRSLRKRDLRLFFAGQAVSLAGTWMQSVAQSWLVWRLTRSTELLGIVNFLGQVPVFLFGIWAGSIADRHARRRIVLATQTNAIAQAVLLAVLTLTGTVRPWHVVLLAGMLGLTYAFEIPARQALLADIAGPDVPNAIALNSSIVNAARIVGPALAGGIVAAVGEGWCFALNALSFAGTYYALWVMDRRRSRGWRGAGARTCSRGSPTRGGPATSGRCSRSSPSRASSRCPTRRSCRWSRRRSSAAAPGSTGSCSAAPAVGALAGAIGLLLRKGLAGLGRRVAVGATLLGAGLLALSFARHPALAGLALAVAGFGFITQMAGTMTLLQGLAPADMRGRVMGLFSTLFVGVTPFGALAAGFAASRFGAPRTLAAGAAVVVVASAVFHLALPRLRRTVLAQHPTLFPPMSH